MSLFKTLRTFLKLPLTLPLQFKFIRKRVAFELKYHWFADLEIGIPLTEGFGCSIPELDSFYSFSEIFVTGEYGSTFQDIPLPRRWIDLGCHTGYFSLYLAWQHGLAGSPNWSSLLIDADPRMEKFANATLQAIPIGGQWTMLSGMISAIKGEGEFALRPGMGSSSDLNLGEVQEVRRVRTISASEIESVFPPPYDLIKIDIEGGEYDFLEHYKEVYTKASFILLEWHSLDREGTGGDRAKETLARNGFRFLKTVRPKRELLLDGKWYTSGVQLYQREEEG